MHEPRRRLRILSWQAHGYCLCCLSQLPHSSSSMV